MACPASRSSPPSTTRPAAVLAATLRSVTDQTFADWELCLVDDCSPSPHVARAARRGGRGRPPHPRRSGGPRTAASCRVRTTAWPWPPASSSPCSTTTTSCTPTPSRLVDEALEAVARGRLRLLRRGQDRRGTAAGRRPSSSPTGRPSGFRTQMYTCHVSVLRRIARRRGRRVRRRRSRAPRTGTSCCGSPSGPARSCTSPRALPLAHARRRPRPPAARRPSPTPTRPARGRCRPTATASGFPAAVAATPRRSGVYHLQPRADRPPARSAS